MAITKWEMAAQFGCLWRVKWERCAMAPEVKQAKVGKHAQNEPKSPFQWANSTLQTLSRGSVMGETVQFLQFSAGLIMVIGGAIAVGLVAIAWWECRS